MRVITEHNASPARQANTRRDDFEFRDGRKSKRDREAVPQMRLETGMHLAAHVLLSSRSDSKGPENLVNLRIERLAVEQPGPGVIHERGALLCAPST